MSSLAVAAETLNTTKRTLGKVIIVVRDCIDHDDRECRKVKNEIFTITTSQEAEEIRWNEMRRLINDGFSGKEVVLLPPAHDSTREMARPTFGIQHVCEEFSEKINGLRSLIQHASSLCEPGTQQCMTGMFAACALRTAVTSTNRGEGVFPQGAMVNVVAQIISRKTDHCKHQLELLMQAQRQLLTNPDGYEVILRRELTAVKERVFSSISLYRTYPAHAQAVRYIDAYITNLSTAELQRNLQAINAVLERHGQDMNNLLDVIRTSLLTAIAQDYTTVSVAKIQQDFATAINTCLDDIRHVTIPASGLRLTWPIVQRALQGMETKGQDICNLVVQDRNEQELCVLRFREYAARVRSQDPKWSKPNEALENLRDSHHDIHKNIEVGGITFVDRIRGSAEVIDITAVVQDLRTRMATMHTRGSSLVARAEDWGLAISSLAAGSAYLNVGVPEYNGHSLNTLVAWCWNVCKDLDCADEVAIRFVQETSEARKEHPDAGSGDCGQGFAGRFKNALRGFVDVDYQTLDRDTSELFLMAWMHHVVNAKDLTMRERRDKAGEVLDEYKVTGKRLAGYLGYLEEFFAEDA
ncbi:hypothetical protein EON65_26230 [archaeon]|nr:MAG: hypothetical protein EON65_26230 [archaeon]